MATGTSDDSNTTVTEDVLSEGVIDANAVRVAAQLGERSGTSGPTNTQGELFGCVRGGGISKLAGDPLECSYPRPLLERDRLSPYTVVVGPLYATVATML